MKFITEGFLFKVENINGILKQSSKSNRKVDMSLFYDKEIRFIVLLIKKSLSIQTFVNNKPNFTAYQDKKQSAFETSFEVPFL